MKSIIKSLLHQLGYKINHLQAPMIENYFRKKHPRSVLISYITLPFKIPAYYHHTNGFESHKIAQVFDDLGFNVDIIDWSTTDYTIFYNRYDLIFGFGEPFENSFRAPDCSAIHIYYGTGCHPIFQNTESLKRLKFCYENYDIRLTESVRLVDSSYSISTTLPDFIIVKGNSFVADTYRPYFKGSIKSIDTSTIEVCKIEPSQKNFAEAKRHFLYFGSLGLVHKGLDLVLKAFAKRPDCFLHVCIPLSNEPLFERTFHKELYETANIKTYGFIDIRSELFKRLLNQCAFLIFPSASEGGCAGQANLMRNGGLIPLMTLNAGLDIEDFGIIIQSFSVESVLRSIIEAETLTEADCQKRAEQSLRYALERHTLEQFHHTFKKHLLAVLDETKPLWTKSP